MSWNVDRNSHRLLPKFSLSPKPKLKLKQDLLNPLLLLSSGHHHRQQQQITVKHLEVHYGPSRKQKQISICQCRKVSMGSS
jgi:hypothetical protein